MKYVSEITGAMYDSVEELQADENRVKAEQLQKEQKKAQRAERAKEIDEAIAIATAAQKKVDELIEAFIKDYGSYHKTLTEKDASLLRPTALFDFLDSLFEE